MRRRKSGRLWPIILALLLFACAVTALYAAVNKTTKTVYPLEYTDIIGEQCDDRGIDPILVCAVIKCESGFDPNAVSSVGARGLMQLTEETFEWIRWSLDEEEKVEYDDVFDPETNIRYGVYLLSYLLEHFENEESAVAAYHAGINRVDGWLKDENYSSDGKTLKEIPYSDTKYYVSQVSKTKETYESLYRKG